MDDSRQPDRIAAQYYSDVSRYELPSKEEEVRLFAAYRKAKDGEDAARHADPPAAADAARHRREREAIGRHIACGYVRFVMHTANKKTRDPELRKELYSEGNIGLMVGVERFDPSRKVRFLTYAAWWINVQMQEHLKKQEQVHVPNHTRKALRKKKKEEEVLIARGELTRTTVEEPSMAPLEPNLHAAPDDTARGAVDGERNLLAYLVDARLPLRDRLVLIYYFGLRDGTNKTFGEIAQLFFELDHTYLTSDRVRQIKERSLATLREHLTARQITSTSDLL